MMDQRQQFKSWLDDTDTKEWLGGTIGQPCNDWIIDVFTHYYRSGTTIQELVC
jgi:hypothetical protein